MDSVGQIIEKYIVKMSSNINTYNVIEKPIPVQTCYSDFILCKILIKYYYITTNCEEPKYQSINSKLNFYGMWCNHLSLTSASTIKTKNLRILWLSSTVHAHIIINLLSFQ